MNNQRDKQVSDVEMDWQQVVRNGGPPCFYVVGTQFCGRAKRWAGHGDPVGHEYVSLNALLSELEALSLQGICVYCGAIENYESLEDKAGASGEAKRIAHIRECAQRPEKKLIAYATQLREALQRAHACGTLREDGTCDGCFVSEALEVSK